MLYEFWQSRYHPNVHIFLSDIQLAGISDQCLQAQIKKLTDSGLLRQFDTGIYSQSSSPITIRHCHYRQ